MANEHSAAGYTLSLVGPIRPKRDRVGAVIDHFPQPRYRNKRNLPLHTYGRDSYGRFRLPPGWRRSGAYVLTSSDGEPLYVGECQNLESRWNDGYGRISPRNCYLGGQETNCRINSLIHQGTKVGGKFDLWFYPVNGGKRAREAVESELIAALKPLWNR